MTAPKSVSTSAAVPDHTTIPTTASPPPATTCALPAPAPWTDMVSIRLDPPLAHVTLQDSVHGNRITPQLRSALPEAMRQAASHPDVRVIVLAGQPQTFCAGGTSEDLTHESGTHSLDGWDFVRAAADCPLPVVSSVQGHAIGGGLLLALYADAVVLSETSRYCANFLTYGFTPCLGATFLLPSVMGQMLGTEMLYSGRPYLGRELAARGAGVNITAHHLVAHKAVTLAQRMAQAPRLTLELLKQEVVGPARQQALSALGREIANHAATLTSPEVRQRITALYPVAQVPSTSQPSSGARP
ncbi:polyketide synthase (plasmid) [Streptomyces globisporus]|uniref:polyketide synthase n=1 Tax=Streptomyces globisporus TaxID=1908 RepID=UPI002F90AD44|nr:polyketide synthase [Streptomyces globisporus]